MIERHVYVKLKPEHAARKLEVADAGRRELPKVPGVVGVRVGLPADVPSAAAWDVTFTVLFERIEDVEPYRVHPTHLAFVRASLDPYAVVKKAWNFSVG